MLISGDDIIIYHVISGKLHSTLVRVSEGKRQIASYYHYIKAKISFDLVDSLKALEGPRAPEAQFKH